MTSHGDLGARFAKLRVEQTDAAPSFAAILDGVRARQRARSHPRVGRPSLVFAVAVATAAAVTASVVLGGGRNDLASTLLSETRWQAPSDFLLRTPGATFLASVPEIVSPEALLPATPAAQWREP